IVSCDYDRHGTAILEIFNQAIATSTALYDYQPRTLATIQTWFEVKTKNNYPIIGIESDRGSLMGFASYGTFRSWAAYKYSIEHSVYVDSPYRGRGIGKKLLQELIKVAQQQNYHMMIGGIDAENHVSIKLHQSMGFQHCGTIKHAGYKFGRWLDLEFYQLILATRDLPTEE
ncbi:MAG: GNAT family N-acetyltransferase, partial [Pleurocapsa sp.]